MGPSCRRLLVMRLSVGGPTKEERVGAGSLRAVDRRQVMEGRASPLSVPWLLVVAQRSEAKRREAERRPRARGAG